MDIFRNARQNFLRRQAEADQADLERQEAQPEMQETRPGAPPQYQEQQQPLPLQEQQQPRASPMSTVLRRFGDLPRPSVPAFVSRPFGGRPRPSSSRYDDDDDYSDDYVSSSESDVEELRGPRRQRGPATGPRVDIGNSTEVISPKTPQFGPEGMPPLASDSQRLPELQRTHTNGPSRLPARPPSSEQQQQQPQRSASRTRARRIPLPQPVQPPYETMPLPMMPLPVMPAEHIRSGSSMSSTSSRSRRTRRRFNGADPAELLLADMAEDGRHRREGSSSQRGDEHRSERRQRRQQQDNDAATTDTTSGSRPRRHHRRHHRHHRSRRSQRTPPKRFLFCFPWVQSRRMRSQILQCFVSGLFVALMLAVYLGLLLTGNIANNEFSVMLILVILAGAIVFSHGLVRLCLMVARPESLRQRDNEDEQRRRMRRGQGPFATSPDVFAPGGYAVPREPIRVVLARDEEAAGIESIAAKTEPPAYGLWRESVRVDPNRLYWKRNDAMPDVAEEEPPAQDGTAHRPPSYASEDGVSYVVEAQPRSIAPSTTTASPAATATSLPPMHPAESGRLGRPPAW